MVQVRVILQPVMPDANTGIPPYLIYSKLFKFASELTTLDDNGCNVYLPAPRIGMFLLHCHKQTNGSRIGEIFSMDQILEVVELIPKHGLHADLHLNCDNLLEGNTFYLNNFVNKKNFHAILSYQ